MAYIAIPQHQIWFSFNNVITSKSLQSIKLQELSKTSWHSLPAEQVAEMLQTDPKQGLDLSEANNRLQKFGENTMSVKKEKSQ